MSCRGDRDSGCRTVQLALAGLLVACRVPGPSLRSASPSPPLEVEYAGCEAVLTPGPVCVLRPSRELRLWVGAPPEAGIQIRAGRRGIDTAGEPVRGGQRFTLTLPATATSVAVLVEAAKGRASWLLSVAQPASKKSRGPPVQPPRQPESRDLLREVQDKAVRVLADLQARRLAAVRATLDGIHLPSQAPAESRYFASYGRAMLAEGEGDYRTALAEIQKAVETAEQVDLGRYRWLAEEELALLMLGVGRSREAAQLFERLRRTPQARSACEEAQLLTNQAWSALLAREAGEAVADPTGLLTRALATYETCKRVTPEKSANVLLNLALAHLQAGRLEEAQVSLTRAHRIEPRPPLAHTLWWLDLDARLALSEGRPAAALSLFDRLEKLAVAAASPDGRLRAAFGKARSQQSLGDRAAALATLLRAEAMLDEQSLQIPVQEGRELFMATRQAVVSLHVELLLDQGGNAQALDAARHARSRLLRQIEHGDRLASLTAERRARWERLLAAYQQRRMALEERAKNDWRLPGDQLRQEQAARREETEDVNKLLDQALLVLGAPGDPPGEEPPAPRPGELILSYHPLPHGWVGFAADGKSVAAHRFELPPEVLSRPEELARRLLLPFRTSIRQARRLRILASGVLQGVDFHALPFDGDVVLAGRPVVYGLDLPVAAAPARTPGGHALVVADPRSDLPGARAEGRAVVEVLASGVRPWVAEEVKHGRASAAAVRGRLATADLLHYAGHGTFSGAGGWESGLLLADETELTLGDFLALARVPAWVVLSGCDTGRSSAEIPVEGLGLAHAFLLAGSQAVVASTRPADDRTVPAFFIDLYRQWDREPDLAVALQRAQLAWRQRGLGADWASFRLFEP
jgi:tetratricopeptide (TPR) repeat protein